jgi:prenyltransferase beta subunit
LMLALFAAFIPAVALAQAPDATARKKETLRWVLDLQDPNGGFYMAPKEPGSDAKPGLRATSAAVRAIKYLGGEIPNKDKHAAFVLTCFDPKTGGFAEQSGKPDVTITSIGVMAAAELGIPKEKYAKAMDYLKQNAKTFEDVRIGAAAVEAWGVKDCPFKLDEWEKIGKDFMSECSRELTDKNQTILFETLRDGVSKDVGSYLAFALRLDLIDSERQKSFTFKNFHNISLKVGQRRDGGWSKRGEKDADIESTYRVMRALMLLKEKPNDMPALRKFVESHRNKDGGYATKPSDKSSAGGTYYAVIILKWLDEMEK